MKKSLETIYLGYTVFTRHKFKPFCCVFFTAKDLFLLERNWHSLPFFSWRKLLLSLSWIPCDGCVAGGGVVANSLFG